MTATHPWDQQPQEPPAAYARFCTYLQLGPGRSLPQLASELEVSLSSLKRLSGRHQWMRRAALWDRHLSSREGRPESKRLEEARDRQWQDLDLLEGLCVRRLKQFIQSTPEGKSQLARELTLGEVALVWADSARFERQQLEAGAAAQDAQGIADGEAPAESEQEGSAVVEISDSATDALRSLLKEVWEARQGRASPEELREIAGQVIEMLGIAFPIPTEIGDFVALSLSPSVALPRSENTTRSEDAASDSDSAGEVSLAEEAPR